MRFLKTQVLSITGKITRRRSWF